MSNLIYTTANSAYYPLLHICVDSIRRFSNVDICCLVPESDKEFKTNKPNVYIHKIRDFDPKYTSKFLINAWERSSEYESILYIDADQVCVKDVREVFNAIKTNRNFVSAGVEHLDLNKPCPAHKFSEKVFAENQPAYSAGFYGFNRGLMPIFKELLEFIDENWQRCLFDQPLFNEFFIEKGLFSSALSPYVYYYCLCEEHDFINSNKNQDEIVFVHALSGFGNIDEKFNKMKEVYEQTNTTSSIHIQ